MMQHQSILIPRGFLSGPVARSAISGGVALPFVGQKENLAFSMVEIDSPQRKEVYSVASLLSLPEWQKELEPLTSSLPMAGLPKGPLVMGILNVTPDSFSDGGRHFSVSDAIQAGYQMVQDGAAILDIGGESTRPGSRPVSIEEECHRVLPVIRALKGCGAVISVDTRHAETMKRALEAGADMINDISALDDPESVEVIAQAQCPVILMHMRGTPQTMIHHAVYTHVLREVMDELAKKVEKAIAAGIQKQNIILDPGIGFAKNGQQNMALLRDFPAFVNLGCRLLLAVSRKRFIKEVVGDMPYDHYDSATMIAASPAYLLGNGIVRVHNVPAMVQTVKIWDAIYR